MVGRLVFFALNVIALMVVVTPIQSQQSQPLSLPTPSYIPNGFVLRSVFWNPVEGFGGGDNERALIYVNGGRDSYTSRNVPLQVIVSADSAHEFAHTKKADGISELIHMDDGSTVTGKYFNGEWVSRRDGTHYWDSDEVHSLVFDFGGFHVGIRGPKRNVTFEEVLRIAGSFAKDTRRAMFARHPF
jgi:hypothetical protein